MQLAINILELVGLLLIGFVSIDTYGSKRRLKPQIALGLLFVAGILFVSGAILLILNNI
ncbi:hypothetical protein P4T89_12620 [Bacillus nakamurai]|uniref:hypothetical protein n=1 Tax=Bacillus nakamurai TaxID=1793963 RepID=UPI000B001AEB|nr:hypothetical protein [Bacillus nakamurai]MED1228360.1 hypothetical protein [Bacillus nakamurai]